MNAQELRDKSEEELGQVLVELRREQFNLRLQQVTGEMTHHHEHRRVRRDIARVKTVLNQRKRAAGEKE